MRLKGTLEAVPDGWTGPIVEDAEPGQGYRKVGFTTVASGAKDACTDFVRSASGRLAVRGGMQQQLALVDGSGNAMTRVCVMQRYSQDGAVLVAHDSVHSKHWAFFYGGALTTQLALADLTWNAATPARPRVVELFEDVYVADATVSFGGRQPMVALNAAGVLTAVTADLGAGAEAIRPFCHAVYNNVLFIAGQDANQTNAPAMVRHSFLGVSPSTVAGWDKDSFNTIGAAGERVTAMVPGNNILLIAKENQLYRLSGFGRGLPGWQYVVQQLDNTDYVGVKWPGALIYAENYWYGVGQSGPFRTDGVTVELLVPTTRQRTWRQVTALDQAFVRYDPDRRVIIFGLVYGDNAAVQDFWLWRIDEEQWDADWHIPIFAADVYALAQQGLAGPSNRPASISINDAAATLGSFAGTVALGDPAASTEIWVATVNLNTGQPGAYLLYTSLGPGLTNFTFTGSATVAMSVKARHLKNGQYSDFSPAVVGHTLVAAPTVEASPVGGTEIDVTVTSQADKASLTLQRNGVTIKTWGPTDAGIHLTFQDTGLSGSTTYTYTAFATESSWPAAINTSGSTSAQATTGAGPMTAPSAPAFLHSSATLASITGNFTTGSGSNQTEVWVDHGSGFVLDQTLPAGVTSFTVSALADSTAFPVKLRHKAAGGDTSAFGGTATGYTLLKPPTVEQGADPFRGTIHIFTTAVAGDVTLYWQTRGGQIVDQWTSTGGGHSSSDARACGTEQGYVAVVYRASWPIEIATSGNGGASLYSGDCL